MLNVIYGYGNIIYYTRNVVKVCNTIQNIYIYMCELHI